MVVCSSGSAPKPTFTGATVAFSLGSLAALLNNITTIWAVPFAGYLGVLTYDATLLCGSDPPPMPVISASDVLALLTLDNVAAHLAAVTKFSDLVANVLWPQMCQCISGSPSLPTFPAAPSPLPLVNPPALTPTVYTTPCIEQQNTVSTPLFGAYNILPNGGTFGSVDTGGHSIAVDPTQSIGYKLTLFYDTTDPTGTPNGVAVLTSETAAGGARHTEQTLVVHHGNTSTVAGTLQAGAVDVVLANDLTGGSGITTSWKADLELFCGSQAQPLTPCCPPDPTLQAELDQVLQYVQLIYQSLPSAPSSYADATAHVGLTGNGTLTLADAPLAVRVNITTDASTLGVEAGSPEYLFDRGYIVPVVNSAPIRGETRLVYNPQLYLLPALTEQLGYSLASGLVVTITELVAGP